VHRPRLFAQHLPSFGWEPIILTVHEKYYEEKLDHHLEELLPKTLRIEKVKAFRITKPRFIGDIGLRGFFQLYKRAKQLILSENINVLYIPIPSYYCALLGRWLHKSTRIKYAIDYIDPWVHNFPGSDKFLSRHWISTKLAKFLEPIAIKNASLITGVAESYYQGVIDRNPQLIKKTIFAGMPYGGEQEDHDKSKKLSLNPYLFRRDPNIIRFVYAGAMLPKAYVPLEKIFQSISQNINDYKNVEFYFIGTGKTADDPGGFNIKPFAEKYGLWQKIIFEHPKRIPYLDVLVHLEGGDSIFILGSTEPHYTPSKIYQGVLSGKPILAVLHCESSGVGVIRDSKAGLVLDFNGIEDVQSIKDNFNLVFQKFLIFRKSFQQDNVDLNIFNKYSAKAVTKQLADKLDQIT
jgi:hypothetical protein